MGVIVIMETKLRKAGKADMEYKELRLKVPKKVYQAIMARCALLDKNPSGVVTAILTKWAKGADKAVTQFLDNL